MAKKIYVWGLDSQVIRDQVADRAEVVQLAELPASGAVLDGLIIVADTGYDDWSCARQDELPLQDPRVRIYQFEFYG